MTRHSAVASLLATAFVLATAGMSSCGKPTEPALGFSDPHVFSTHIEIDVRFESSDGTRLVGTLLLPESRGPHPAVVAHFGSDRWTRYGYNGWTQVWLDRGFAVFTYDKRGVGESGGVCCPWQDEGYFSLLAEDVLAGTRVLATHGDIDAGRIGLYGFSQGGWVVPVAAAKGAGEVAFTMIGSGPVVTLGEELLFSELSGSNDCESSDLSHEEIETQLDAAGPSGFDPMPYLEMTSAPGLWMYCAGDLSVPVERSMRNLREARDRLGKDWTIALFPNCNHVFVIGGGPCQGHGQTFDWVTPAFEWLDEVLGRPGAWCGPRAVRTANRIDGK